MISCSEIKYEKHETYYTFDFDFHYQFVSIKGVKVRVNGKEFIFEKDDIEKLLQKLKEEKK